MAKFAARYLFAVCLLMPGILFAADLEEPEPVHWAYSSFFGTGWYRVDNNRSVFVLGMSPKQGVRDASLDNGERKLGLETRYPVTLGLHNLDYEDLPGNLHPSNFGTASFTPGLELEIPVSPRWFLRPSVAMGAGIEFETKDSAWIWEAGLKSRYTVPSRHIEWSVLGGLNVAGHDADGASADSIFSMLLGLEARQPLKRKFRGRAWDLHWHASYTFLDRELKFDNGDGTYRSIDYVIELGVAVSPRGRSFRFWRWTPDRLGLGIKFSPEGDFAAIILTSRSWFEK